ncbi:Ig-like domain-containing protein [soil metagenome]
MPESDYFLSLRPAYPWSLSTIGLPALGLLAFLIIAITVWTYFRHPAASRRRIIVVLMLRLVALLLALITAIRPSIGIQEDPRVPSTLLIGIDMSESMTIRDEFNNQSRIAAVRKILEKCEPTLETLRNEQNVNVVFYAFGSPDFSEPNAAYDANAPAAFKRSDYGAYLSRTSDKWQAERFVRAHVIIGDGADNGTTTSAESEAARWRGIAPIHTFSVGKSTTRPDGKDVAIAAVSAEPSPVPIKNDVTLKVTVNAFGFPGAKVPLRILFDDKQVAQETVTLVKEFGNEVTITVKAPETPGEIRVRAEIPLDSVPGDVNPSNNVLETYLTVTKEGVRVLLIDRDRFEHTLIRDILRSEKRFDITDVVRQRDEPPSPDELAAIDFNSRAYDVIVIGNVSAKQLQAIDPKLPEKLRDQVRLKGSGLIMLGGDASFTGTSERPLDSGWRGTALEDVLPVSLTQFPNVPESMFKGEDKRFQTVPTDKGLQYLMKVGPTEEQSKDLWNKLNQGLELPLYRMTAISRLGEPKRGALIYATASDSRDVVPAGQRDDKLKPPYLLVGWETDTGGKGRVLAFAGYDTYLWKPFGLRNKPPSKDGREIHAQFWRRLMLWLAKQDDADGAAYARPEYRRLPVRGKQNIRVGLRTPEGADAKDAVYEVKIVAPGQTAEQAATRPVLVTDKGTQVLFDPPTAGEYTVLLKAVGKDGTGKEVKGDATSRFLAYPEASDELLRAAADLEYLERLARAGGGQPHVLSDLPQFLSELKGQPLLSAKKPRFIPDWRRNHSKGFLPGWVIAFVLTLATEWGLRRLWGMA